MTTESSSTATTATETETATIPPPSSSSSLNNPIEAPASNTSDDAATAVISPAIQLQEQPSQNNVLLLGVSFPDISGTLEDRGLKESLLTYQDPCADQSVELVRRSILTEMDARDHARCVETERAYDNHDPLNVYTVSREVGGIYRKDRHIYANFNNSRTLCQQLGRTFGFHTKFRQVILDYYWMPTGWLVTRWAKSLFQNTLPDLVRHRLLDCAGSHYPDPTSPSSSSTNQQQQQQQNENSGNHAGNSNNNNNDGDKGESNNENKTEEKTKEGEEQNGEESEGEKPNEETTSTPEIESGVVFLPFCAHVCKELVGAIKILRQYYSITFVKKSELAGHALWKGTMRIDGKLMQHRLGKRLDQEEIYCTFNPNDIYKSMEDPHINKDDVMTMLLSIDDFDEIRMIRLKPLRQHAMSSLSVSPDTPIIPEKGGFVELDFKVGRKRFKEFKSRRKAQKITVTVSDPEAGGDDNDSDGGSTTTDYDTDDSSTCCSSCDEDHLFMNDGSMSDDGEDVFDPDDPSRIPDILNFYPYPSLDLKSYTSPKELVDYDYVLDDWAKTWGPKAGRKSRKVEMNRERSRNLRRKSAGYMSINERFPPKPAIEEEEEGYKWTWVEGHGWKMSLVGEVPDLAVEPRIVGWASRNYDAQMTKVLFEIRNRGHKTWSRTWMEGKHLTCYRIPRKEILFRTHAAQDAEDNGNITEQSPASRIREEKKKSKEAAAGLVELAKYLDNTKGVLSIDRLSSEKVEKMDGTILRRYLEAYGETEIPRQRPQRQRRLLRILAKYRSKKKSDGVETVDRVKNLMSILRDDEASDDEKQDSESPSFELLNALADQALTAEQAENQEGENRLKDIDDRFLDANHIPHTDDYSEQLPPFKVPDGTKHIRCNLTEHINFPFELYKLLQHYKDLVSHIVSWQEKGKSFKIHDEAAFERDVLSQSGEGITLDSFKLTLSRFGFESITNGDRAGGYCHELFRRGEANNLPHIFSAFLQTVSLDSPRLNESAGRLEGEPGTDDAEAEETTKQSPKQSKPIVTRTRPAKPGMYQLSAPGCFETELHRLLEHSVEHGLDNILRWQPAGDCFVILDRGMFVEKVLVQHSQMTSWNTFMNKLGHKKFRTSNNIFWRRHFRRGEPPARLTKSGGSVKSNNIAAPKPVAAKTNEPDDFISTVYSLLGKAKSLNIDSFMKWKDDGKSFTISRGGPVFENNVKPHFPYFTIESFLRRFTSLGFEMIGSFRRSDEVTYCHPQFIRGRRKLLEHFRGTIDQTVKRPLSVGRNASSPAPKRSKRLNESVPPPSRSRTVAPRACKRSDESVSVPSPSKGSAVAPRNSKISKESIPSSSKRRTVASRKRNKIKKRRSKFEYTDCLRLDPQSVQLPSPRNNTSYYKFPKELFQVLANFEDDRDICHFADHGRCFFVHNEKEFLKGFGDPKMDNKKFVISLRYYGFHKLQNGRDEGGYFHELFMEKKPDLMNLIRPVHRSLVDPLLLPENETPDFWAMPFVNSTSCVDHETRIANDNARSSDDKAGSVDISDSTSIVLDDTRDQTPNTKESVLSPLVVSETSEVASSTASIGDDEEDSPTDDGTNDGPDFLKGINSGHDFDHPLATTRRYPRRKRSTDDNAPKYAPPPKRLCTSLEEESVNPDASVVSKKAMSDKVSHLHQDIASIVVDESASSNMVHHPNVEESPSAAAVRKHVTTTSDMTEDGTNATVAVAGAATPSDKGLQTVKLSAVTPVPTKM